MKFGFGRRDSWSLALLGGVIFLLGANTSLAGAPSWFDRDTKAKDGWTFYCQGEGKDETESLGLAQGDCSRKMCLLFGVEVQYNATSNETLKDANFQATVKESCPQVRIVGRVDRKKNVDCEDGKCTAFLSQFYPMSEYLEEKKRLNNPPVNPAFEKTVIVREGNETFKDPKECRAAMGRWKSPALENPHKQRLEILEQAIKACAGIDYRNVDLNAELTGLMMAGITSRGATYVSVVTTQLGPLPNWVEKLKFLKTLETLNTDSARHKAEKLVFDGFDFLFARNNFDSSSFKYKRANGTLSETNPYLDETKNCQVRSRIVRGWPKGFFDDVTVCLPEVSGEPRECQTTSILLIRGAFAGCLCQNGAPEKQDACLPVVLEHMNTECPLEMPEACFRSMSKMITEKMKFTIHDPYKGEKP